MQGIHRDCNNAYHAREPRSDMIMSGGIPRPPENNYDLIQIQSGDSICFKSENSQTIHNTIMIALNTKEMRRVLPSVP